MSARSQRLELERGISYRQKRIAERRAEIKQWEISLKYALENQEESRLQWLHHRNNRNYAKQTADVVDVREYPEILKRVAEAKVDHDTATANVLRLRELLAHGASEIREAEQEIIEARQQVAQADQGAQVLQFVPRH